MAQRHYNRFPRGESCSECPARRWYLESGRRYCENGHQVEGYIQFDVDADDNFGKTGKVIRKQREAKVKQHKHLSGNDAKELYLECLQLVLRKQVAWLIREKGFHPDLESVCRDLWDLRIRRFVGLTPAPAKEDKKGKGKERDSEPQSQPQSQSQSQLSSNTGLVMYSSQTEAQATTDEDMPYRRPRSRVQSWYGEIWALPGVMDTLAIVYLACLLRQEPVRIGDLFRWTKNNQLPFLGAIDLIPMEWSDRLPGWAHRALLTRYVKFEGSELHKAVLNLMLSYSEHYGMSFPPIPLAPLLLVWIKDMALPPEVYRQAQELCSTLDLIFSFPTREKRREVSGKVTKYALLDIPDSLLAASVVFAAKYVAPMDDLERLPRDEADPLATKIDWEVWEAEFARPKKRTRNMIDFEYLDPDEIWSMSNEMVDEYMNWFQETQIDRDPRDETEIDRLFPLEDVAPLPVAKDKTSEEIEARIKRVQSTLTHFVPGSNPVEGEPKGEVHRLGDLHPIFERSAELWGPAKRLYEVVAEASGLSLEDLIQAVYKMEKMMMRWEKQEKRRLKEMDAE